MFVITPWFSVVERQHVLCPHVLCSIPYSQCPRIWYFHHNFFRLMVEQWTHLKQNEQVTTPFEFPCQYTICQERTSVKLIESGNDRRSNRMMKEPPGSLNSKFTFSNITMNSFQALFQTVHLYFWMNEIDPCLYLKKWSYSAFTFESQIKYWRWKYCLSSANLYFL